MYQVGDIVRIKNQFWRCATFTSLGYNESMKRMQGQEYEIRQVAPAGIKHRYRLYADAPHNWIWDEAWLEPASEIKDVYTEELDLLFMGD